MNLVFAWVVHGVDIGALDALNSGVEPHLAGTPVIVASEHPCALDPFIPLWVALDIGNDGHDRCGVGGDLDGLAQNWHSGSIPGSR
ncbi:Uncharacterised protein [Mycobacterium tuberculosis]|nr:Uncharacterised protein [Mycobacterium tuberculosis]